MIHPVTILLAAGIAFAFSGCATTPRDPLAARQKAYERLASFLEPGMTRRQVYALLPPQRIPTTSGLEASLFVLPPDPFSRQHEFHALDRDFALKTYYTLAHSENPFRTWATIPSSRSKTAGTISITPDAIDRLLFETPPSSVRKIVRSKQDMNDTLNTRPIIQRIVRPNPWQDTPFAQERRQ